MLNFNLYDRDTLLLKLFKLLDELSQLNYKTFPELF